ncbi:unnamed protein product [Pleuronectes platessa]|uniref:Uncharacterized protein n=1 Tax=Pleuronectes platessa TaxID=8262 RepID=A0A9N7YNP3_PLEPL|nr:unnamed protein product [Pleuronectes platessa]
MWHESEPGACLLTPLRRHGLTAPAEEEIDSLWRPAPSLSSLSVSPSPLCLSSALPPPPLIPRVSDEVDVGVRQSAPNVSFVFATRRARGNLHPPDPPGLPASLLLCLHCWKKAESPDGKCLLRALFSAYTRHHHASSRALRMRVVVSQINLS